MRVAGSWLVARTEALLLQSEPGPPSVVSASSADGELVLRNGTPRSQTRRGRALRRPVPCLLRPFTRGAPLNTTTRLAQPQLAPTLPLAVPDYSNDTTLAHRVASGERYAQHELFRTLKLSVHATLYRILGSNEHMEDLVQDSFIEIFRSIGGYRGEARLTTWADRIAARVAFHYLKRRGSSRDQERAPVQLHVVGSPEDHAHHREGLRRFYALLRRMKPEHQIALALFLVDGRSLEEVAVITGVTLVAVKNRVSRARSKLWQAARRDQLLIEYLTEQGVAE